MDLFGIPYSEVMVNGSAKRADHDGRIVGKSPCQSDPAAGVSAVCAKSYDAAYGAANAPQPGAGARPGTRAAREGGTRVAAAAKSVT